MPFRTRHWPPFKQIFIPEGQGATGATVGGIVVVTTISDISQKFPSKRI